MYICHQMTQTKVKAQGLLRQVMKSLRGSHFQLLREGSEITLIGAIMIFSFSVCSQDV